MSGKQFLYILIATFLTLMIWVTVDIIHARSQVKIPEEVQKLLEPISPVFDQEVINDL